MEQGNAFPCSGKEQGIEHEAENPLPKPGRRELAPLLNCMRIARYLIDLANVNYVWRESGSPGDDGGPGYRSGQIFIEEMWARGLTGATRALWRCGCRQAP